MIAFALSFLPGHRATEKYAGVRRKIAIHSNGLRVRTFAPAVHGFGENRPKWRQKDMGRQHGGPQPTGATPWISLVVCFGESAGRHVRKAEWRRTGNRMRAICSG